MVFFRKKFNDQSEAHRHRLTAEMTQAVYRGDISHVEMLYRRGGHYTSEMLSAAVHNQSEKMVDLCLSGGVQPEQNHFEAALSLRDLTIAEILAAPMDDEHKNAAEEKIAARRAEKSPPRGTSAPVVYY